MSLNLQSPYRLVLRTFGFILYLLFFLLNINSLRAQVATHLQAEKNAVVEAENAKFTVLTDRLIRMEWDNNKVFDDHASFLVVNRRLPVPAFTSQKLDGWLYIRTSEIELAYKLNSGRFNRDNLRIRHLRADSVSWFPGKKQKYNLKGTTRTLDNIDGNANLHSGQKLELEDGVLSRDGWFFLNASSA